MCNDKNIEMNIDKRSSWLEEAIAKQVTNWMDMAIMNQRNADYYKGLVEKIGETIGIESYIQDDGNLSNEVLCDKVPEIVEKIIDDLDGGVMFVKNTKNNMPLERKDHDRSRIVELSEAIYRYSEIDEFEEYFYDIMDWANELINRLDHYDIDFMMNKVEEVPDPDANDTFFDEFEDNQPLFEDDLYDDI